MNAIGYSTTIPFPLVLENRSLTQPSNNENIFPYMLFCVTIYDRIALWNLYLLTTTKLFEQKVNKEGKTIDFNKEHKK